MHDSELPNFMQCSKTVTHEKVSLWLLLNNIYSQLISQSQARRCCNMQVWIKLTMDCTPLIIFGSTQGWHEGYVIEGGVRTVWPTLASRYLKNPCYLLAGLKSNEEKKSSHLCPFWPTCCLFDKLDAFLTNFDYLVTFSSPHIPIF